MRLKKPKRYLFIGGPNDRKKIRVEDGTPTYREVRMAYDIETTEVTILDPHSLFSDFTKTDTYHLLSVSVGDKTIEAYVHESLWGDRNMILFQLLTNYGKQRRSPRPKKWPKITFDWNNSVPYYPMLGFH